GGKLWLFGGGVTVFVAPTADSKLGIFLPNKKPLTHGMVDENNRHVQGMAKPLGVFSLLSGGHIKEKSWKN
ncbi:MAG: hypothetical protein U9Q97_08380, partial [Acidobacteriota bacterium]|nr:hypothetical protein [Acidobacteriota bacterium]